MLSRWSGHPCGSQHQTVLPEYSDFTEAVNYLRSRKLNSVQRVKYRQDIAAAKCGGTLKVECAGCLSLRVWSGKPRGKEWSTPAAPTVGHSHPLLPDSALLSSVLTAAVASMFSMLIFKTISRIRTRLIAGLLRPLTATWERYWNLAMLWDRPHSRPQWTAWVWMLLKSINARFLIQYRLLRSNAEEGYGQHSNTVYRRWRLNACERVRRRQWERCINLGLLTVTYGRAFWGCISYRIAIFCAVSYRIHRFPPRPYRAITNMYLLYCMQVKMGRMNQSKKRKYATEQNVEVKPFLCLLIFGWKCVIS